MPKRKPKPTVICSHAGMKGCNPTCAHRLPHNPNDTCLMSFCAELGGSQPSLSCLPTTQKGE